MNSMDVANTMAQSLVELGTDPNEVASALNALREMKNGSQFRVFLRTVVQEGHAVVRSKRTLDYYRHILQVCDEYLVPYEDDILEMAYILGWVIRLMRFYRVPGLPLEKSSHSQKRKPAPQPSAPSTGGRLSGRVKFFNTNRGFGFIIPDGGGKDIFVHKSKLAGGVDALSDGQRVTYEVGQGRKGPEARNVRVE